MKSIIFNEQQIYYAVENKKGVFRAVIKPPKYEHLSDCNFKGQVLAEDSRKLKGFQAYFQEPKNRWLGENMPTGIIIKSKFQVGETIFVKESFWRNKKHKKFCWYDTDIFQCSDSLEKVNAKFMKQEQSRLFLKITGVKVKKLQEIVEEDIKLEGFKTDYKIWNSTHIKPEEKWEANPWVWAFDYEVI
jgi:hypothetical protein